jgi:hypothetical protein
MEVGFVVVIGGLHRVTKTVRFRSSRNFIPKHAFASIVRETRLASRATSDKQSMLEK